MQLKKTKTRVRLLPAGVGLGDCGRNDLNHIAAWMLRVSRLSEQEEAELVMQLKNEGL